MTFYISWHSRGILCRLEQIVLTGFLQFFLGIETDLITQFRSKAARYLPEERFIL